MLGLFVKVLVVGSLGDIISWLSGLSEGIIAAKRYWAGFNFKCFYYSALLPTFVAQLHYSE